MRKKCPVCGGSVSSEALAASMGELDPDVYAHLGVIFKQAKMTKPEIKELVAILSIKNVDGSPAYSNFVIKQSVDAWVRQGYGMKGKRWGYFLGIVKRTAEEQKAVSKTLTAYKFDN